MWPRIFQGSLGCGDGSLPLLCWSNVKGPSQSAKLAMIRSQSPKILERSLATRQIFRSLGFFKGSLTCGQGSFKDLWGVARDLCHFCVGHTSRVPHRAQKWQRSQASPQRSLKNPWPYVKYSGRLASLRDLWDVAKDLSRIFWVWRRIFATFVLVTRQGSLTECKSGKDPKPVPKDP